MKRMLLFSLAYLTVGLYPAFAQSATAEQILQKVKNRFDLVKDYTATLKVTMDMERLQIPEMFVTVYFKQPDKVHIESRNFAMVPREIAGMNPSQFIDKYDATVSGTEWVGGAVTYKLRLVSKPVKGKPVHESYIWVDGTRWVITRYESTPSDVRKVAVDLEYETVDGMYMLPSKIEAHLDTQLPADSSAEKMYGSQRLPRKGTVTILYSGYKVNAGLSDEIFQKKEENGKR